MTILILTANQLHERHFKNGVTVPKSAYVMYAHHPEQIKGLRPDIIIETEGWYIRAMNLLTM